MTREEIKRKVNDVFCDVFDDDSIVVTDETTAKDIEDWDSLTHITLVSEIEDVFKIRFSMKEVLGMKNVGEMVDYIARTAE
ncbi:MAG: phosphopantetheine-binding protein [Sphaerochaetaceae bacterium]